MQIIPIRIFYQKTGRIKYISHLDTVRTISRALKRSKLPLWYTQGFNPHLYLTFALPLSLGHESLYETMDVRLTQPVPLEKVTEAVRSVMPPGFVVQRAAHPVMEPASIAWSDYHIVLRYRPQDREQIQQSFASFGTLPTVDVEKRTKKGIKTMDIKPHVQVMDEQWEQETLQLNLRLAAGNQTNINPTLYLKAFYQWADWLPEGVKITRTGFYNDQIQLFQ